jgi:hypothetical protein
MSWPGPPRRPTTQNDGGLGILRRRHRATIDTHSTRSTPGMIETSLRWPTNCASDCTVMVTRTLTAQPRSTSGPSTSGPSRRPGRTCDRRVSEVAPRPGVSPDVAEPCTRRSTRRSASPRPSRPGTRRNRLLSPRQQPHLPRQVCSRRTARDLPGGGRMPDNGQIELHDHAPQPGSRVAPQQSRSADTRTHVRRPSVHASSEPSARSASIMLSRAPGNDMSSVARLNDLLRRTHDCCAWQTHFGTAPPGHTDLTAGDNLGQLTF